MVSRYDELARAVLAESTPAANVGDWVEDRVREDAPEVTDVVYTSAQSGYRGWSWVVSIAEVDGEAPTVLELSLLPGEDSLVAPEWVPWSVRLAEWQAQQAVALAESGEADGAESEESDDVEDDASDDELEVDDLDDDEDDDDEDDDDDDDDDDLEHVDDDVLDDDIPLEDLIGDELDEPDESGERTDLEDLEDPDEA